MPVQADNPQFFFEDSDGNMVDITRHVNRVSLVHETKDNFIRVPKYINVTIDGYLTDAQFYQRFVDAIWWPLLPYTPFSRS